MLPDFLIGFLLVAANVAVHAFGLTLLTRHLLAAASGAGDARGLTWLFIRTAWFLIALHGVGVSLWALAYWLLGCLPDIGSAFYFSGTTYTTIGYGDLVLPTGWRLLAPLEGMTGILMSSLSGAYFFAVVTKVVGASLPIASLGNAIARALAACLFARPRISLPTS
jgi:hypothetical protein